MRFDQVHKSIGGYKFSWTELATRKLTLSSVKSSCQYGGKNVPRFIEKVQILKLNFSFH